MCKQKPYDQNLLRGIVETESFRGRSLDRLVSAHLWHDVCIRPCVEHKYLLLPSVSSWSCSP